MLLHCHVESNTSRNKSRCADVIGRQRRDQDTRYSVVGVEVATPSKSGGHVVVRVSADRDVVTSSPERDVAFELRL
ncbi:hypothetical protein EVAR_46502_1 [Eumeta japonica]|uniref:Uncharacterized protein n=1 Tax=Eumeta variegata TaxID=151549 RepID=A0A4C1WRL0_EUMVA|nr:hypothetical protein EVAR_46502_1 [Eumeta japonica]